MFDIMVACTKKGGIGKDGTIPWYLPPDLKYFRKITIETSNDTRKNAVIMGKNTWRYLPKKPLSGRMNIVLTTSQSEEVEDIIEEGAHVCKSLDHALLYIKAFPEIENVFVIGGERLYKDAIDHPQCRYIYVTMLDNEIECDTFFPIEKLERQGNSLHMWSDFTMVSFTFGLRHKNIQYEFRKYEKCE